MTTLPCKHCGIDVTLSGKYVGRAISAGQTTTECEPCSRERMSESLRLQTDFFKELHKHNRKLRDH